MHDRMRAKLYAFLNPLGRTLRIYKESDNWVPSRYARAIGLYREGKLTEAIALIDGLIAEAPSDPYFNELRGQVMFENARLAEAADSYGKAATLLPTNGLIRRELARVQLEFNQPQFTDAAITNLEAALASEREHAFTWWLLAIAYGRKGDEGRSSIALAEEALIKEKPDIATYHAGRALGVFKQGTREWLQAEDIRLAAKEMESRKKRGKGQ
ncbi:MAG: tetratricopeptide repeat protein [Rhodospirillaceae bacterium]